MTDCLVSDAEMAAVFPPLDAVGCRDAHEIERLLRLIASLAVDLGPNPNPADIDEAWSSGAFDTEYDNLEQSSSSEQMRQDYKSERYKLDQERRWVTAAAPLETIVYKFRHDKLSFDEALAAALGCKASSELRKWARRLRGKFEFADRVSQLSELMDASGDAFRDSDDSVGVRRFIAWLEEKRWEAPGGQSWTTFGGTTMGDEILVLRRERDAARAEIENLGMQLDRLKSNVQVAKAVKIEELRKILAAIAIKKWDVSFEESQIAEGAVAASRVEPKRRGTGLHAMFNELQELGADMGFDVNEQNFLNNMRDGFKLLKGMSFAEIANERKGKARTQKQT